MTDDKMNVLLFISANTGPVLVCRRLAMRRWGTSGLMRWAYISTITVYSFAATRVISARIIHDIPVK